MRPFYVKAKLSAVRKPLQGEGGLSNFCGITQVKKVFKTLFGQQPVSK